MSPLQMSHNQEVVPPFPFQTSWAMPVFCALESVLACDIFPYQSARVTAYSVEASVVLVNYTEN